MSRRDRRSAPGRAAPSRAPIEPVGPVPFRHPALWLAALACALAIALSVTHDVADPDQWQHLTVGRYVWEAHRFPTVQLWTWPTYGAPDVDYAWGFEALAWPAWKHAGLLGLYLWRWIGTLAVFALAWWGARRMGARGLGVFPALVLAAMVYRARSQVRPETVAAVLLAAEIAILEVRRHGGRAHPGWLVLVAWAWANTHISYYLFFLVLGVHLAAALLPPRRNPGAARTLAWTGLAALAVSFANPSGWRTLWQPFEFWLVWRHEPVYQAISEMRPIVWRIHLRDGLPLMLVLWPVLALARARRPGLDRVEAALCLVFTAMMLVGQRFTSVYAVAAAPYLARDLDERLRALPRPAGLAGTWARGAAAAATCVLVAWPALADPGYRIRLRLDTSREPVGAGEFIARHGLRGRFYNPFEYGGWICWRFWPGREQLPFMGIHQEGTVELRRDATWARQDEGAWRALVRRWDFGVLVLPRGTGAPDSTVGFAERDTAWARVFSDDAAHVYVRRDGPFARLAADSAYRVVPADPRALEEFGRRAAADPALRRAAERELRREVAGSPWHARALGLLANVALSEARWEDARRDLEEALRIAPLLPGGAERLGLVALARGRPREALRRFDEERRATGDRASLALARGRAHEALGDLRAARADYARAVAREPGNAEARDSLASAAGRLGR